MFLVAHINAIVMYTVSWKSGKLTEKPKIEASSRYVTIGALASAVFLNGKIGVFIATLSYFLLFFMGNDATFCVFIIFI